MKLPKIGMKRVWIVVGILGILLAIAGLAAKQMPSQTGFWGRALIKQSEGFYPCRYVDVAGVATIGYGHTRTVESLPKCIGYEKVESLLSDDLRGTERCIYQHVDVPLSQNQYDALSSFTFNLGCGALRNSTLLRKLNRGEYDGAADEFHRWNKAGGRVWEGLVKRRARERWLFEG